MSVLCTPYGTSVITYYRQLNAVTPALARNVVEWQVPNPLYRVSVAFFVLVAVVAVAVAVAWRRGTRPDPLLAAIALVLLGLALTAIRNQTWFSIAGCLLAADALARSSAARPPRVSRAFGYAAASVLAGVALAGLGVLATRPDAQYETQVPVRAVDVAAALAARHPTARILGDDVCAPVLLWLYPATFGRVGFDARLEQYSLAQLDEYAAFLSARGRGWQRVMRGYDIVVASRHHPRLATALVRLRGWRLVYSGPGGNVAERRP